MKNKNFIKDIEKSIPKPEEDCINKVVILGQQYMNTHNPKETPLLYLFREQIKYLSLPLWLGQIISIILIFILAFSQIEKTADVYYILLKLTPIVSVMGVPELIKDVLCNMSELENSCKNHGSTLLLLRLIAVGTINLIVMVIISGVIAGTYQMDFFVLLLYAFIPYNCANIISLFLIRILKIYSRLGALSVSIVSVLALILVPLPIPTAYVFNETCVSIAWSITTVILAFQILLVFKKQPKGELIYGIKD